ncbi:endonuclease/exonuclease/phosphatase family protein [Streptomyces sp. NPDC005865]|uniref:endonuclease/exonuclease/phosphatase family protein n=1 Tax=Streptomyces sp. NPDC005865 TaxID=3155453 RepID=UPI0033CF7F88
MRRTTRAGAMIGLLLTLLTLCIAPSAQAGDILTEKSAGRRFALQSKAATDEAGKPVCASVADPDGTSNQAGKLRARVDCADARTLKPTETFTLHTDKDAAPALRSEANGQYVSAEFHDADPHFGMLRARQSEAFGGWEKFKLVELEDGWYALRYKYTQNGVSKDYYVSARVNLEGEDKGLLRASTDATPGSWERFKLVDIPFPSSDAPPAAALPAPARSLRTLTWNTCSNNGACKMAGYSADRFTDTVTQRATAAHADVIFLQEFCEKLAKPLEHKLEARDGGADTWDVRFAPIQLKVAPDRFAQKTCTQNRGAYGVAIAVPAENTWYKAIELDSPDNKERRTALCAAVRSWAVMACTAHFSTGGPTYDDPERHTQQAQAAHMAHRSTTYSALGYRTLIGGDLNATPTVTPDQSTVPVLQPLYDAHKECDQPTNRPTAGSSKLDYLFATSPATWSGCTIGTDTDNPSDHRPVWGTVALPAR